MNNEADVLAIPAGEIKPSDVFYNKGQRFTVWSVEYLGTHLIRIHGEVANYQTQLICDDRLLFQAVIRPTNDTKE